MLHDPAARFQHVALKTAQIEATADFRLALDPQDRRQVEGQQRQPQGSFVDLEIIVRKKGPDRLLKFANPILERASLTIVRKGRRPVEFLRLPANHQEEIVGQQIQLACLWIRSVDDHQQQTLRMSPRLGLIWHVS